jgi:hypothetical protein
MVATLRILNEPRRFLRIIQYLQSTRRNDVELSIDRKIVVGRLRTVIFEKEPGNLVELGSKQLPYAALCLVVAAECKSARTHTHARMHERKHEIAMIMRWS